MSRRRSGLQPMHLAGAVAFLVLAGGAYWLFARDKQVKLIGNPFSAAQFGENQIVRGNTYVIKGKILEQLSFSSDSSRLFSVAVQDEGSSEELPVPVLVPAEFSGLDIQVGQAFEISVLVEKNTSLRAKDIRKS